MRFSPPLRMSVTRRGEKERRLGAFIGQHLADAQRDASRPGNQIRLIARSVDSPVVKAIAALAPEIVAGGHSLRLIVAQPDRDTLARDGALADAGALQCEVRWARNPRLMEAHEQLVLGPSACWTGDSMRRDPAKCDAYESFIGDSAEAAGSASASFERLWMASEPLLGPQPVVLRDSGQPAATTPRC